MRDGPSPLANHKPNIAAFAAIILVVIAVVLVVMDMVSPHLSALTVSPALIGVCMALIAMALREWSMRTRLSDTASAAAKIQQKLKEQIRWLELTEAHTRIGHWRLNLATNDVFWSDATYAIHALEPGTPPKLEDAINFYHEDDRDMVTRSIEQVRKTGHFRSFKARLTDAKGVVRHVESGASVELDGEGEPIALFGVFKDRSNEERMQAELRQASEDALALARAKGMFLARMSHEIRTPMNGLMGFAELLSKSDLSLEQRKQVQHILNSGHSLLELLEDILDFTKGEAGNIELNPVRVMTNEIIESVIQSVTQNANRKGLRLIKDVKPDVPPFFKTDPLRLRQILTNLLANAVRMTEQGSIALSLEKRDDQLLFSVRDTGPGIAPHMLERIFDPFTQKASPGYAGNEGTGLGLPISRNLAELMDGNLKVESKLGNGAKFTLSLPFMAADNVQIRTKDDIALPLSETTRSSQMAGSVFKKASKLETQPTPANPITEAHPPCILLAEDFDINRELVVQMAARLGFDIDCAVDGKEAVGMVHKAKAIGKPYDGVLMDLQMPKIDGIAATKRLRAAGITADELPIIAVTANAFADDVDKCFAAGMQAHLAKPLSLDQLDAALQKWVPAFRRSAAAA